MTDNMYLYGLYLAAFISSMLSLLLFSLNFEKAKLFPAYFEYDSLDTVKYILSNLYLYPSTFSIYSVYKAMNKEHIESNTENLHHLPPPTCHYMTNTQNNRSENEKKSNKCMQFLCFFTFWLYMFCDFCCRSSPVILFYFCLDMKTQNWLFWVLASFLMLLTLYLVLYHIWLHHFYCDYFKPSHPFWRYTIKPYLQCHYVHPLRSILDTEPFIAWILRNCLFWFGVLIICNISVFGFIFNRPTLYNERGQNHQPMHCIKAKVEKFIISESLIRYFLGFVAVLLCVLFDRHADDDRMTNILVIWIFVYCILAVYAAFIVQKAAKCTLFRVDAVWIERVQKRGWCLSKGEEGLMWHRYYQKAQSFQINKRKKHLRKIYRKRNKLKRQIDAIKKTINDGQNTEQQSQDSDCYIEELPQEKPSIAMVGISQEILSQNETNNAANNHSPNGMNCSMS